MIKTLPILLLLVLSVHTFSQTRAMDNLDLPLNYQKPAVVAELPVTKKKKFGRYRVVTEDKLVKKTASMKATMPVTDGLASRESAYVPNGNAGSLRLSSNSMLKGFTTGNPLHDSYILESSQRYGIDPLLIYSQMHQESAFKIAARSYKGASGLMQLMPATARRFGVTKIFDPRQNIDAGVKYMRWLLDLFGGDVALALAGYNAGEGAVMKYGYSIPPYRETREYVRRISARYAAISDPRYVQSARPLNPQTAKNLKGQEVRPLTVYEPLPMTVRLPNGKTMLHGQ